MTGRVRERLHTQFVTSQIYLFNSLCLVHTLVVDLTIDQWSFTPLGLIL